jgi:hypothetical protein
MPESLLYRESYIEDGGYKASCMLNISFKHNTEQIKNTNMDQTDLAHENSLCSLHPGIGQG